LPSNVSSSTLEFAAETAASDVATETLEKITIKPKKTNIAVKLVGLVWTK
jgi:hypothetical protein